MEAKAEKTRNDLCRGKQSQSKKNFTRFVSAQFKIKTICETKCETFCFICTMSQESHNIHIVHNIRYEKWLHCTECVASTKVISHFSLFSASFCLNCFAKKKEVERKMKKEQTILDFSLM